MPTGAGAASTFAPITHADSNTNDLAKSLRRISVAPRFMQCLRKKQRARHTGARAQRGGTEVILKSRTITQRLEIAVQVSSRGFAEQRHHLPVCHHASAEYDALHRQRQRDRARELSEIRRDDLARFVA